MSKKLAQAQRIAVTLALPTMAAIVFVLSTGGRSSLAQQDAQKSAIDGFSAPFAYPTGPCDPSDILGLIGKDGPMVYAQKHAASLVSARISACTDIIHKYLDRLPSPPPDIAHNLPGLPTLPPLVGPAALPTFPANCRRTPTSDVIRQYQVLDYCYSWIARNVSSPTPASSVTPAPVVFHTPTATSNGTWTKAVYVLALAADAPTSAQIALQLADDLRDSKFQFHSPPPSTSPSSNDTGVGAVPVPGPTDPYSDRPVKYQVLAEPSWTLAQYQQQCATDSSTAGAVVVLQPGTQSSSYNLLFSASWTALSLQVIVLDCEPTNTAYVNNASFVTWITHVRTGTGRRYSVSLASMLGLLSGVLAVHPTRTTTYTVSPPSPLPPRTTYENGYSSGTNQGVGIVAAAGVAGLTPLATTNVGQGATVDAQTAGAMARVLPELLRDLISPCTNGEADPSRLKGFVPIEPFATQCRWFSRPKDW